MTEEDKKVLERVKSTGEFTISGNSGGYEQIIFEDDKFYFTTGFGAVEENRREISQESALQKIKKKLNS